MTDVIIAYLLSLNVLTFALSIIDKVCAVYWNRRVPERLILALSLAGGAVGAKLAHVLSGRKSLKREFITSLNLIAVLQFGLAAAIWSQQVRDDGIVVRDVLLASFQNDETEPALPKRFGPGS